MRRFFAIDNGDILNREKIGEGLERLRSDYGQLGYINFTADPNTNIDDESKLISIDIVFHEGRQFYLGGLKILGSDEPIKQKLLKNFPMKSGQVYNSRIFESFLLKNASMFPDRGATCAPLYSLALDETQAEEKGMVTITLDLQPCCD